MKVDVLVAEIGSTTTVLNAFINIDSDQPVFWGQGQAPTSVLEGDVRIGLKGALDDLCKRMGEEKIEYDKMLATSSAAGGLKMSVHGLVYDMTAHRSWLCARHAPPRVVLCTALWWSSLLLPLYHGHYTVQIFQIARGGIFCL